MADAGYLPHAGDIIWLDLDPRTGHEQSGHRPCLVLSDKLYTERTGLAVVCPITSKVKGLPFEVHLGGTKTAGAVLPIHVRSVDVHARHARLIERAPQPVLALTRDCVKVITGMAA
jgi:mRNA interferase MazF